MYSPRIYESQVPSLYHASQAMNVPMTQLVNAFVYYGLISGFYSPVVSEMLPQPNRVVPEGVRPRMQIFHPHYHSIHDCLRELPLPGALSLYLKTLDLPSVRKAEKSRPESPPKRDTYAA